MFRFLLMAVVAILSGCATGYHPLRYEGGYSDLQLAEGVYKVDFVGNAYVTPQTVAEFALLRCAELTLEKGGKYFAIIEGRSDITQQAYTSPVVSTTNFNSNAYGNASSIGGATFYNGNAYGTATTTTYGGQTYLMAKPSTSNIILVMAERPADGFVFDAQLIADSVRSKHRLNEPQAAPADRCAYKRASCQE